MDVDLEAVLEAKKAQYKSIEVRKDVELQYDVGNLLATDLNPLDHHAMKSRRDEYLKGLARDNTQLLINKIWQLPVEKADGMILVELPTPSTVLPREKPIPKPKGLTAWETFAKAKGIKNRKRSRMVFDESGQEWKPRWGYKRVDDPKDKWMIEIPDRADPYEDYFEKQAEEKKEKIAKNEYKRLKNISRTQKGGRLKAPLPPPLTKDMSKYQLTHALGKAKEATASIGKFTKSLVRQCSCRGSVFVFIVLLTQFHVAR
ncbi:Ribosome biogenesis regulatory protein homolog [Geodia barretti]|uniref:Ribosome biogenesis regulatory protein n=1 Tax=Geodia barretti TaxID=519541 RepID=A0AA35S772_GEOBA|nr:Ribosome biogenesis regulatory protein homolog [Geodia barretti]